MGENEEGEEEHSGLGLNGGENSSSLFFGHGVFPRFLSVDGERSDGVGRRRALVGCRVRWRDGADGGRRRKAGRRGGHARFWAEKKHRVEKAS